jgi:hypothetical protein
MGVPNVRHQWRVKAVQNCTVFTKNPPAFFRPLNAAGYAKNAKTLFFRIAVRFIKKGNIRISGMDFSRV